MGLFIRRSKKAEKAVHILTVFIIAIHGYDTMEKGESGYWIFYAASLLFLLILIFHKPLHKRISWIDGLFHGIEAFVLLMIAYHHFHLGKVALPSCYLAAGLGHVVTAYIKGRKGMKSNAAHEGGGAKIGNV